MRYGSESRTHAANSSSPISPSSRLLDELRRNCQDMLTLLSRMHWTPHPDMRMILSLETANFGEPASAGRGEPPDRSPFSRRVLRQQARRRHDACG